MSSKDGIKNSITIIAAIAGIIAYLITRDIDTALAIGGCVIFIMFALIFLAAIFGNNSE